MEIIVRTSRFFIDSGVVVGSFLAALEPVFLIFAALESGLKLKGFSGEARSKAHGVAVVNRQVVNSLTADG